MPIYTYVCSTCTTAEDYLVKAEEKDTQTCNVCGAKMARQLPLKFAVKYNTGGFYSTDK